MDQFAVINQYHVKMLAYFLEKLRATPDGDGTLLDHSMILYGSSLSDGNEHNFDPLPVRAGGRRIGTAARRPSPAPRAAHADVEPAAGDARQARCARGRDRRQHRAAEHLNDGDRSPFLPRPASNLAAVCSCQQTQRRPRDTSLRSSHACSRALTFSGASCCTQCERRGGIPR